jgi:hypothetical protein
MFDKLHVGNAVFLFARQGRAQPEFSAALAWPGLPPVE